MGRDILITLAPLPLNLTQLHSNHIIKTPFSNVSRQISVLKLQQHIQT